MTERSGSPRSGVPLRRARAFALLVVGASTLPVVAPATAAAAASPAAATVPSSSSHPAAAGATELCRITDERLPELSGLVVVGDRLLAVNDGGDAVVVHVLDTACRVVEQRSAPVDPYDPEDLALSADGTVWVADTGDNRSERATVALLALRPDGSSSVYRLTYPDGPHDAEALVVAPDGTPYLVTKDPLGASGVYRPVTALVDGGTVTLARVGTVALTVTGTPGGPVGAAGQLMITGGAVSGDGRLLALRTYTDAYVWPLAGSDVAGALAGTPARVPLPESRQGEAISFAADDRQLVVAGEGLPAEVLIVPTQAALAPVAGALAPPEPDTGPTLGDGGRSPLVSGLIAATVATVVVWIGGLVRRRE